MGSLASMGEVPAQRPVEVLRYRRSDRPRANRPDAGPVQPGFFPSTGVAFWQSALQVDDALVFSQAQRDQPTREYLKAVIDEAAHGHAERAPEWMKEGLGAYVIWRLAGSDGLWSLFSAMGGGTKADAALERAVGHPISDLQKEVEAEIADL